MDQWMLTKLVIFTILMVFIWIFFLVAKIHTQKFKDYSVYITPVTRLLAIALALLTIFGYYEIATYKNGSTNAEPLGEIESSSIY